MADAAIDATQVADAESSTIQEHPRNDHVTVIIDTPADAGGVAQQNAATATATAEVVLDADDGSHAQQTASESPQGALPEAAAAASEPVVVQAAVAEATSTQHEPSNTNVSVRVGSPGDNGPVAQANTATAEALAAARAEGIAVDAPATEAVAAVDQTRPSNTNVVVRVFAPGDDGAVEQSSTARAAALVTGEAASATTGEASAAATQTGARNTNVAIRVGSDGTSPRATQTSTASATTTSGESGGASPSIALVDGDPTSWNTDVRIVVDAAGLSDPSAENAGFAAWIWKWTWTSDVDLGLFSGQIDPSADPGSWQWEVVAGDEAASVAGRELVAGDWVWSWSWERPGDWTWAWSAPTSLDCNCAWVWDWSWSWGGDPDPAEASGAATPGVPDAARDSGTRAPTITQSNTATAAASATASAELAQTGEHDAVDAIVSQSVAADVGVVQDGVANSWWGIGPVGQENAVDVAAKAGAHTDIAQAMAHADAATTTDVANPPGDPVSRWASQEIQVSQQSTAGGHGVQDGVANTAATRNRLGVSAVADATLTALQEIGQVAGGDGGRSQWAGQLARVEQVVDAIAIGLQTGVDSSDSSREASAIADARAEASSLQSTAQEATSTGETLPAQWAGQHVEVAQHAGSTAIAEQTQVAGGAVVATASTDGVAAVTQDATQSVVLDGGEMAQWVGQLTLIDQLLDADATAAQSSASARPFVWSIGHLSGALPASEVSPLASARAVSSDLALVSQSARQGARRSGGLGDQTSTQLVGVSQVATATAATTQSVGASTSALATSDAEAVNRSLAEQLALQVQSGSTFIDIQVSEQATIVEQLAAAASTSAGGIGGAALAVNCSIVQQVSGQWIGAAGRAAAPTDQSAFCNPPAATPAPASLAAATPGRPAPMAPADAPLQPDPLPFEDELAPLHGSARAFTSTGAAPLGAPPVTAAAFTPPAAPPLWMAPNQVSTPHSPQARFDTRPGSTAGSEDTGREPPLPPVDGPPSWASALAAAASAAGSSGIASILFAFALVPALWLRVRDGSVVRRPTSVLAGIDVPV